MSTVTATLALLCPFHSSPSSHATAMEAQPAGETAGATHANSGSSTVTGALGSLSFASPATVSTETRGSIGPGMGLCLTVKTPASELSHSYVQLYAVNFTF